MHTVAHPLLSPRPIHASSCLLMVMLHSLFMSPMCISSSIPHHPPHSHGAAEGTAELHPMEGGDGLLRRLLRPQDPHLYAHSLGNRHLSSSWMCGHTFCTHHVTSQLFKLLPQCTHLRKHHHDFNSLCLKPQRKSVSRITVQNQHFQ